MMVTQHERVRGENRLPLPEATFIQIALLPVRRGHGGTGMIPSLDERGLLPG